jgi:hypothetical protein
MPTAQELIENPEIARFVETHQSATELIRHAASQLAGKPDALAALKKVLPALDNRVVNVFFSYKKKDEVTARVVVDVLRECSAEKLQITFQGNFTKQIAGTQWRRMIHESVRQANWFILLLPDPADDLDWCLYETGLFEAQLTSADRLICLHHPHRALPDPIRDYHAVAAKTPEIEEFLRMTFIEENSVPGMPPINRAIEKNIPALAERIREAIRAPHRLDILEPWIEFQVARPETLKTTDDLDAATVVAINKEALNLFDLLQFKGSFGQLRESINEVKGDSRWREELARMVQRIAKGKKSYPIQAVFESPSGRIFRPVVHAVNRVLPDESIESFQVTFTEEVTVPDRAAMPADLAVLATLLRFTFRFRWEVLERFSKGPLSSDDIERLDINFRRIMVDWECRGMAPETDIFSLFADPKATSRLREMTAEWRRLSNRDRTGELDIAIEQKDGRKIPALLSSILPMNQEFLEMAADRFAEMIGSGNSKSATPMRASARANDR